MYLKKEIAIKFKEALAAILPIACIVIILCLSIVDLPPYGLTVFLIGTVLLMIGMVFFTLGADISMMTIGEQIGSHLTKSRKIGLIALICFILGVMITIAEPDLRVLADTIPIVDSTVLIICVAVGVGVFLVISFFRVYLQVKLSYILIVMYSLMVLLALSPFIPNDFIAIAFDSGGVTTGPITVPFIMALGVGLASVRSDKTSQEDSFGLVALCSIGPILTVLILGMLTRNKGLASSSTELRYFTSLSEIFYDYGHGLMLYSEEVAIALLPILAFFIIFNIFQLKLNRATFIRVVVGMIYTFIGLVLFLTGVNIGFMSMGYYIGYQISGSTLQWLLIPLGALIGYFIVAAEPAVHVLKQQVEDITEGHITGKALGRSLAIGIALSVALSMCRVLTGLSIWYFLLPGYAFSLIMTFFVPPIFTSIAFDAGGVASGPMTATFLLPLAMGACAAQNGNPLTDAFGLVAYVAMTPLVTIQLLGLIGKIKASRSQSLLINPSKIILSDEIIEYALDEEVFNE